VLAALRVFVIDGRRDRVVLATKFGMEMSGDTGEPRGAPAYVRRAVEGSLERLRTERIDLLYYHEPDGVTPLAETLGALGRLADEGKIRTFGVSNLDAAQLREAAAHGDDRLVALQNEYSLLERGAEQELLPLCVELGSRAVEAGFRVVTGGLGGVMEAVSRGARTAPSWREGDVVGILPGYDRGAANPYVDVVVPTGMQIGRNVIVVAMGYVRQGVAIGFILGGLAGLISGKPYWRFILVTIIADSVDWPAFVTATTLLAAAFVISRGIAKAGKVLENR